VAGDSWPARATDDPSSKVFSCDDGPGDATRAKACQNVRAVLDASGAKMVKKIDIELSTPDMSAEVLGVRAAAPDHIRAALAECGGDGT
jgi:hypothetical protein